KECISEMLRTGYCKQGIILFLERIDIKEIADGEKKRTRQAYILSLSDGAKRINGETFHRLYVVLKLIILLAVLRSEIDRFVVTEETIAGCYVSLDKYSLRYAPRTASSGVVALVHETLRFMEFPY